MMRDLSHGNRGRMERQKEREREMSHGVRLSTRGIAPCNARGMADLG